jgi:hypothetical protein
MKNPIHKSATIFLITCFLFTVSFSYGQLKVTVVTTPSTCSSNGSLTVTASGGSGNYAYALISPVITQPQNSNVFTGLAPAVYRVEVTDINSADIATALATVSGNYTLPALTASGIPPSCYNTFNGAVAGTGTSGKMPYAWTLYDSTGNNILRSSQVSDTFLNVTPGNYFVRLTDACGNFQTRVVAVNKMPAAIYSFGYSPFFTEISCDSFRAGIQLTNGANGIAHYPYSIKITDGQGDSSNFSVTSGSNIPVIYYKYQGYGVKNFTASITDACGTSVSKTVNGPDSLIQVLQTPYQCAHQYVVVPSPSNGNPNNSLTQKFKAPIHIYLIKNPNTGLASDTLQKHLLTDDVSTQILSQTFRNERDGNYTVVIKDSCHVTSRVNFTWTSPVIPASLSFSTRPYGCMDSTAYINVGGFGSYDTISILHGPAAAHSTKAGYAYNIPYTYPYTIITHGLDSYGTDIGGTFYNLAPGNYEFRVKDTCGHSVKGSFTLTRAQVGSLSHSFTAAKGCPGANSLYLTTSYHDGGGEDVLNYVIKSLSTNTVVGSGNLGPAYGGGAINAVYHGLNAGSYVLTLSEEDYTYGGVALNTINTCTTNYDTITIPPYTNPHFSLAATGTCNNLISAALLADTSAGVGPYQYQITAGPSSYHGNVYPTNPQSSPIFNGLPRGTYTFLISDACGNSYSSSSIGLDTLTLIPAIAITGKQCLGDSAVLSPTETNPFYSYEWYLPNNSTANSQSIVISPITSTSYGQYQLRVISSIGTCNDTGYAKYKLDSAACALPVTLLSFNAQKNNDHVLLKWITANEINNDYFEIERSANENNWSAIGIVKGHDNSINQQAYTFADTMPLNGNNYYRLKQVDLDGNYTYSLIRTVSFSNAVNWIVSLSPNPLSAASLLQVKSNQILTMIKVINMNGQTTVLKNISAQNGSYNVNMNRFSKGVYFMQATNITGDKMTIKFVKAD